MLGVAGRDQGLLQRPGQAHRAFLRLLGPALGQQELLLVATPLGGVEHCDPDGPGLTVATAVEHRVHQDRHPVAVRLAPPRAAISFTSPRTCSIGTDVRLVVDPRARGQQVDESTAAHQVVGGVAGPGQERVVDLDDGAVGRRREVAARRLVVERGRVVVEQGLLEGLGGRAVVATQRAAEQEGSRASTTSSGALRFGQWPRRLQDAPGCCRGSRRRRTRPRPSAR